MDYITVDIKDICADPVVLFIPLEHDKKIDKYLEIIKKENPTCKKYIVDTILLNKDMDNRFLIIENNTILKKGATVNKDVISRSDFLIGQRPKRIDDAGIELKKLI